MLDLGPIAPRDDEDFRVVREGINKRQSGCVFCEIPDERVIAFNALARTLVRIAFEAQCLKIGQVILATVLSWHDMVNLNSPLIRRDAGSAMRLPAVREDHLRSCRRHHGQRSLRALDHGA